MIFAGDSWAIRAFTPENYETRIGGYHRPGDVRLAEFWGVDYDLCLAGGQGNLVILDKLVDMKLDNTRPIIWVYTEPGRDYGRITGKPEFEWISSEDIFNIRHELDVIILKEIRKKLPNPIGFIGGLSDIDVALTESLGFTVLHPSWQHWIARKLNRLEHFTFGWGAADIGWRMHQNNIIPSKVATFAWDDIVKEWWTWEQLGYFYKEHPTPRACQEFAEYLKLTVLEYLNEQK